MEPAADWREHLSATGLGCLPGHRCAWELRFGVLHCLTSMSPRLEMVTGP